MFELSVAFKYLVPKRRQLSVALISLMSVGVISLVVWLVLVFLSVTEGIERSWLEKLTTLNAPLRITPTVAYYSSYYHQIDGISSTSGYSVKSIGEKNEAPISDPYSAKEDSEIPLDWAPADRLADGSLKDPVKTAFQVLERLKQKMPGLAFQDYEISGAMLRLQLKSQNVITQASYLASFADKNPKFSTLLSDPTPKNLNHLDDEGILLAKNFQDNGVQIGDLGYLAYTASTASSVQEQRLPVRVEGFYDPGILSVGNKCILVSPSITRTINANSTSIHFDPLLANGIQVWFQDLQQVGSLQKQLEKAFVQADIAHYWKITPFYEYDFAKDLLVQFQSDKYLFALVGLIILIVACCNIISLLVLLVNDKKREIGILQTLGASNKSIATIFGLCGAGLGIISSLIGTFAALLTLHHIDTVVSVLSFLQGHEAFGAAFYGKSLPNELSHNAVTFILIVTPLISLCAGLVPAIKACRLRPSAILRSE